jgi:hypothetical protein
MNVAKGKSDDTRQINVFSIPHFFLNAKRIVQRQKTTNKMP